MSALEILPGIINLSKNFKALLLDAYGVFWSSNEAGLIPGTKEVMEKLVAEGKIVGILSNSSQLAASEISKVAKHGLLQGKHFHFFITSGEIVRSFAVRQALPFPSTKNKFWVFSDHHPRFYSHKAIFENTVYTITEQIEEADFVYLSTPHINGEDQEDPEVFRNSLRSIIPYQLPMICPNPDLVAHEGTLLRSVVRQGSIARMYTEMGGGEVLYTGKPSKDAYQAALRAFANHQITDLKEILMVGDTPETDILGARNFGIPSVLITETGVMSDRIRHHGLESAIKNLTPQEYPDYLITRLSH